MSILANLAKKERSMEMVNMHKAKTNLSKLVEKALQGEEVVIAKSGKPLVQIVPLKQEEKKNRKGGLWKGKVWMSPDFDKWPDDIQKAFDGENNEAFD